MDGCLDGTGDIDQQPIARNSGVHSGQTPFDRILSCLFQAPVNIARPMQI